MAPTTALAGSAQHRANLAILVLLGLQRLSYLAPPLVNHGASYRFAALNLMLLGTVVAWNVVMFWQARLRGWFSPWMAWLDLGLACVLVVVVGANTPPGAAHEDLNWSSRTSQAAAAMAGAVLVPAPLAAVAVAGLLATHAAVTVVRADPAEPLVAELVTCLNGILWFAIIIGFLVRYLRRQGARLDETAAQRLSAETRRAAEHAHHSVRTEHHRLLHNTALATLTGIATGGLDHHSEKVRQRCARDAERIRRVLAEQPENSTNTLTDRLAAVVAEAEDQGLRVRYVFDPLPEDVPADAVAAIGDATHEAFNNVARHSGVAEARLTVAWEDHRLTVRVVDGGRGFDADPRHYGFGLARSIVGALRDVGGAARVTSEPGDGTVVELRWPA
ncbi:MAG TPA: ATP-binding protein [Pilimelia sp.]|nr:ATP-binding protein [Pilimelia sp.]